MVSANLSKQKKELYTPLNKTSEQTFNERILTYPTVNSKSQRLFHKSVDKVYCIYDVPHDFSERFRTITQELNLILVLVYRSMELHYFYP
jgi:hypothetical protein